MKNNLLFINKLLLILLLCSISGCNTVSTTIAIKPLPQDIKVTSLSIIEFKPLVKVPEIIRDNYKDKLNLLFYENGRFKKGSGLTIKYRITNYSEGSRIERYFTGAFSSYFPESSLGQAYLEVETAFFINGRELSRISSSATVRGGYNGGTVSDAVNKLSKVILEYTLTNFKD